MPTPRPTAKAVELLGFFDLVMCGGEEVEAALDDGVVVPAVTVFEEEEEEALGSARPMPSSLLPGSCVSRSKMPKLGRVKLEAQSLLRSHSHTPDKGHGKMFMISLRWALLFC